VTALKGRSLSRFRRERLGFVFQDCNLLDTLTAFENIALALTIRGTPAGEIEGRVKETAELLGITDCLNKYPYQMSGGQRQRTAAARAIITDPAPWTPAPPSCCWTGLRPSTGKAGPPS